MAAAELCALDDFWGIKILAISITVLHSNSGETTLLNSETLGVEWLRVMKKFQ